MDAPEEHGRTSSILPRHRHKILPSATHLVHKVSTSWQPIVEQQLKDKI